jgi:hypothetical protein
MRDSKVIQTVAVAATLGAVAAMLITRGGLGPGLNPAPHRAVGAELARQAVAQWQPGGEIMVITRDTTTFPSPATDLLMASFQRELDREHARLSAVQTLPVDPLRRLEVPAGDFQRWIHHATNGDVIVSLLGPPVLTAAQAQELGEIRPAIVAFCPGNPPDPNDLRALFADGLLRAAIVSRREPASGAANPKTPQAWFDQNYTVVTATNVEAFATAAGKPPAASPP